VKRVLLDHCVPRRVRLALADCEVLTAFQRGWNELKNGELLHAAEVDGFDVFVTADKNLRHQQNLNARQLAIVALPTNTLQVLLALFPKISEAVHRVQAGGYEEVRDADNPTN
jgi:hypothetical protein